MTEAGKLDTVGGRLRWAIKAYGPRPRGRVGVEGSIRGFQKALQGRGLTGKGASPAMLYRYLAKDGPAPPADFLSVAAEILAPVRRDWIETGTGPRTPADEVVRERAVRLPDQRLDAFLSAMQFSLSSKALFDDVWRRLAESLQTIYRTIPIAEAEVNLIGVRLFELVIAPLNHFGFRHEESLSERELNDFYCAMLHALMLITPPPGAGDEVLQRGVVYADGYAPRFKEDRQLRGEFLTRHYAEVVADYQRMVDEIEALIAKDEVVPDTAPQPAKRKRPPRTPRRS